MRHTSSYQHDFKDAAGAKDGKRRYARPGDEDFKHEHKAHNEFVNNGELTQSQLQRFFYRRDQLMSKGQYKMNYMALLQAADTMQFDLASEGGGGFDFDLFDRELIEDFINNRTIGQSNYGSDDKPQRHAQSNYSIPEVINLDNIDGDAAELLEAIEMASGKTGLSKDYLIDLAFRESSFGQDMVASTSSARGAYQFIDDTWLRSFKKHAHELGLGHLAAKIDVSGKHATVTDPAFLKQIMDLRFDHRVAAHIAARHTQDNEDKLEQAFPDRDFNDEDLYMAHFLGTGGAKKFFREMEENPDNVAATKFVSASNANRGVFYDKNGTALSFQSVYDNFRDDFQGKRAINLAALEDRDHAKTIS